MGPVPGSVLTRDMVRRRYCSKAKVRLGASQASGAVWGLGGSKMTGLDVSNLTHEQPPQLETREDKERTVAEEGRSESRKEGEKRA